MNPPSWDGPNAGLVRAELICRIEHGSRAARARVAPPTRTVSIARQATAIAVALAVVVPVSILALTRSPRAGAPAGGPSTRSSATVEPGAALVGLWKVAAAGEGASTWVRFDLRSVTVERDRRLVYGSWVTGGDRFSAIVIGWSGGAESAVRWLETADTFRPDGSGVALLAADGRVLATLEPATDAPTPRDASPEEMTVRTSRAAVEAYFSSTRPSPESSAPIDRSALLGRWRTGDTAADGTRPFLSFAADGTYQGSDGCNDIFGKWLLSGDDRLVFTGASRTQVACRNQEPVPEWTDSAQSASIVDGRLVLADRTGAVLGSFDRG